MSDVAEVGEEVVEACVCAMISAPPFIVTGSQHVSVAVEGTGMAVMSATLSGALAEFMLVFSVVGHVRSGEDGMLGWCAVRSVSACSGVARTIVLAGVGLWFGGGLYESKSAFVDERLRSCSASRSHAGVSSSSCG